MMGAKLAPSLDATWMVTTCPCRGMGQCPWGPGRGGIRTAGCQATITTSPPGFTPAPFETSATWSLMVKNRSRWIPTALSTFDPLVLEFTSSTFPFRMCVAVIRSLSGLIGATAPGANPPKPHRMTTVNACNRLNVEGLISKVLESSTPDVVCKRF